MNHQPFETWLLNDQPLTNEESQALREHIESCSQCRDLGAAWQAVESRMSSIPMAAPVPGFMNRFQIKLAGELSKRRKRQNRIALGFSASSALAFLILWITNFREAFSSPSQLIIGFAAEIKEYLSYFNIIKEVYRSITQVLPGVIPISLWIVTAVTLSLLVATWLISVHRLTVQRRVQ